MGRFVSCFRPGPPTDYYGSYRVEKNEIVAPPCDADNEELVLRLMGDAAKLGIKPSLASTFSGATIFLTGGTGYVGSVLIEQLLRGVPDLRAIYVLVRPKHGAEPEARLDRLLARPIFDALRVAAEEEAAEKGDVPSSASSDSDVDSANNAGGERPSSPAPAAASGAAFDGVLQFKTPRRPLLPRLRAKLHVLAGDVCKPRCGLSAADAEVVSKGCDFIVHCAASISFFEHVHVLLEQNYVATRNVLDLAAEALLAEATEEKEGAAAAGSSSPLAFFDQKAKEPRLRGMVHVSTAYVNAHLKRGTHVEERIYQLVRETTDRRTGAKVQTVLSHAAVAAELLALPAAAATKAADRLVAEFGFPNAYTLSKHLAEDAVSDAVEGKLAVFAAAVAAAAAEKGKEKQEDSTLPPKRLRAAIVRPTIIGACAGGPAPGYFGNAAGPTQLMLAYASEMATFLCHNPNHVWDIAPCDIVGSVILGAAAALDVARRVEEATVERGAASSPLSPPPPHQRLLTFHAASSMSNTIRYGDLFCKWVIPFWDRNMPPRRFRASKKYKSIHSWSSFVPEKSLAYVWMRLVGNLKFGSLATLLRVAGQRQPAEALWRGWRYLCLYNDERLDFGLFFCVRNVEAVEAAMLESLAPWIPGAKAYEKGVGAGRGECCGAGGGGGGGGEGGCATAAAAAAVAAGEDDAGSRSRLALLPAGSMTATGDAVVTVAAAAAVAAAVATANSAAASSASSFNAASASPITSSAFLPAPLTWRGDWGPYMHRYSEVIYAKFFGPNGALRGAGGMKKGEKKKKATGGAAAAAAAAAAAKNAPGQKSTAAAAFAGSVYSTTTPRHARAMAGMALLSNKRRGGAGETADAAADEVAQEAASAPAAADSEAAVAAAAAAPLAIQSAPATPARQLLPSPSAPASASPASSSSSSLPSTPPNGPASPRSVFVVSSGGKNNKNGDNSSPTGALRDSSASSSPVTLLRRLTPQRLPKFSLGGGGVAAAENQAATAASAAPLSSSSTLTTTTASSSSASSSSSLADPSTQIVQSDSFKDLSEFASAAAAAAEV